MPPASFLGTASPVIVTRPLGERKCSVVVLALTNNVRVLEVDAEILV